MNERGRQTRLRPQAPKEEKMSYRTEEYGTEVVKAEDAIPGVLIRVFPEITHENFFVGDPNPSGWDTRGRGIFADTGQGRCRQWMIPEVCDLATSQITQLLAILPELDADQYGRRDDLRIDGIEFGLRTAWLEEDAYGELIRRSLASLESQATAWLAHNFNPSQFAGWLQRVRTETVRGLERLSELFPDSAAVLFVEEAPVTGAPEEWEYLPALPLRRKEIRFYGEFVLPTGKVVSAEKIPGHGGYFRVREDDRTDLFLRRGSREMGDQGWMWVLVNPHADRVDEAVEAGIDPLDNYDALRGVNGVYTPLFARIARAHARVRGWEQAMKDSFYSDFIEIGMLGPTVADAE